MATLALCIEDIHQFPIHPFISVKTDHGYSITAVFVQDFFLK